MSSSPSPSNPQQVQKEYQNRIERLLIKDFPDNPKKRKQIQALLDDLEYQVQFQNINPDKINQIKTKINKAKQNFPKKKLQKYNLLEWYVKLKPEKQTRGYMSQKDRRQLIGGIREPKELNTQEWSKIKELLKESVPTRSPTFYVENNEIKRKRPVRISMDCPQQRRTFLLEAFDKILKKTQEE